MRNILPFVLIFALVPLVGCGDGRLQTIRVTGTVTFQGEPLAEAMVAFSPAVEGEGHPAVGTTDANGRFTLQTQMGAAGAGTTPGDYVVTITKWEVVAVAARVDEDTRGAADTAPPPSPRSLIPERFASPLTSGLTATVSRENTVFNFDLTD